MLSLLGKLLAMIPGVANTVSDYLKVRANTELQKYQTGVTADTQVNLALISGYIEETKVRAAQREADRQSLWTVWMMPTGFAICMIHFGSIVFDSMPMFGHKVGAWQIAALPGEYLKIEVAILLAAAGVTISDRIGSVVKRIWTK
jgi:hypothetical protein